MTRLLMLLPRAIRERFGDEVNDAIESSRSPIRDRIDLARWGVQLRMEKSIRLLIVVATVLVVIGAVTTAWATGELEHGIVEIPMHWWSTLATAPLIAGIVLLIVASQRGSETHGAPPTAD